MTTIKQHTCPVHGLEDCQNPYDDIPYHYCTKWIPNDFSKPTVEQVSKMTYEQVRNLGWEEPTEPSTQETTEIEIEKASIQDLVKTEYTEKKQVKEMDSQPIGESL